LSDQITFDFSDNTVINLTDEETTLVLDLNSAGVSTTYVHTYVHNQTVESAEWIINHNLNRQPTITILNTASMTVIANVIHVSVNQARAYFSSAVVGRALCA
jgi:hypothetical protein